MAASPAAQPTKAPPAPPPSAQEPSPTAQPAKTPPSSTAKQAPPGPTNEPSATAKAAPKPRPETSTAIVMEVLGPIVGQLALTAGIPALIVNLNYHHAFDERLGLSVGVDVATVAFLLDFAVVALKAGPRLSLSGRHLEGWYLFPKGIVGWGWVENSDDKVLRSSPLVGAGVELGYTWRSHHFVLGVGGGLHYSKLLVGAGEQAQELGGIMPEINLSAGYGW